MRHRFTVALYDEYPVEAEILDYLVSHGQGKRQEVLRMLVKAGYSAMLQHKDASSAMMNAVDPDALALVVQALSGSQQSHAHQGQHNTPYNPPVNPKPNPKAQDSEATDSATTPHNKDQVSPDNANRDQGQPKSSLFEDSGGTDGLSEFEPEEELIEETAPQEVDEDDLEDPMAKLMSM